MIKKIKNFYNVGVGIHFDDIVILLSHTQIGSIINEKNPNNYIHFNLPVYVDFLELEGKFKFGKIKEKAIKNILIKATREYPKFFL